MNTTRAFCLLAVSMMVALPACNRESVKQTPDAAAPRATASDAPRAAVAEHPLKEAYFGEQHMHTAYSLDAYLGGTRLTVAGKDG